MTSILRLVKLNVGGTKFLLNYNIIKQSNILLDEYEKKLADSSTDIKGDESDQVLDIFVDRNGELFQDILEYWRSENILANDQEHLKKLKNEAIYFQINGMIAQIDQILKDSEATEDDFDYQVIQHPFNCNYLIKPSEGELKSFEHDATIVTGYTYCHSHNAYESKLVIKRPKKKVKLNRN
ncbi:hypothetical protein INT46_002762 [Mucor plumbeus]|uniref:BTB domain-containing protein n=1 Tax=Mucor plumbeus TaxID=97098 RepID=A0A8H7RN59_9FUNG|nr:hypothetical protein INT46_002762 [Mucor plumbeus]